MVIHAWTCVSVHCIAGRAPLTLRSIAAECYWVACPPYIILKATCKVCNLNHCCNGCYWLRSPYFFLRLTSQYGLCLFLLFDWLLEFAITWRLLLFIGRNCTPNLNKTIESSAQGWTDYCTPASCIGGGFLLPPEALLHKQAISIILCFSLFLNVLNV